LNIHPTAVISDQAEIAPDAEIGPFCVLEGRVSIGAHTVIESHARIGSRFGRVVIGAHNYIQHGAALGGAPQDLSWQGSDTALTIGDYNRIGEYASISLGSPKGGGVTRIGDHNFIMAYVHIGHDCSLADHVIITNSTQLAGHVTLEHHALLSGLAGVTQFTRLGAYSFLVGGSFANKDIVPYAIAEGHWATLRAVNRVGLKRAGIAPEERRLIDRALRYVMERSLTIEQAAAQIRNECGDSPPIAHLLEFIASSSRGIARGE
jgi:UDP-N-acetylglucosamine acyltransferase